MFRMCELVGKSGFRFTKCALFRNVMRLESFVAARLGIGPARKKSIKTALFFFSYNLNF